MHAFTETTEPNNIWPCLNPRMEPEVGQYSLYVSMSRNVFCRVELNVFSSSRVEFLPSRMSFARVECLFVESNIFSSSRMSNVFSSSLHLSPSQVHHFLGEIKQL